MENHKLVLAGGAMALAGMAVGASIFGAPRAAAQTTAYRECIIARQESLDTGNSGNIQPPDPSHSISIPAGWTPIGGGGPEGSRDGWLGTIILCH